LINKKLKDAGFLPPHIILFTKIIFFPFHCFFFNFNFNLWHLVYWWLYFIIFFNLPFMRLFQIYDPNCGFNKLTLLTQDFFVNRKGLEAQNKVFLERFARASFLLPFLLTRRGSDPHKRGGSQLNISTIGGWLLIWSRPTELIGWKPRCVLTASTISKWMGPGLLNTKPISFLV
jgi:hypothetical protein